MFLKSNGGGWSSATSDWLVLKGLGPCGATLDSEQTCSHKILPPSGQAAPCIIPDASDARNDLTPREGMGKMAPQY